MRKIIGLISLLLVVSAAAASAAASSVWWSGAQLKNNSNSPVWVTVYESDLPIGPWKIMKASCVYPNSFGSWSTSTTIYMKIRAQAIKGHGDCKEGTYWDDSVSRSANMNGGTMNATFSSLPGGASKLTSP